MNAKQKIHQIKLNQWATLFLEQAASGLTVKALCAENNVTVHTYNYWKHQLKQKYMDSVLPDIVPLPPCQLNMTPDLPISKETVSSTFQSLDSRELRDTNTICISTEDIQISIASSVSEECILQILKAVRHA